MEDTDSDGQSPDTMPGADDTFEDIPIPQIPSFASDDDRHSNIGQDEDSSSDDGESFQMPASSSPTFMAGASELTKKLLYGQITDPREGSTIRGPAEERHPWWFGWQRKYIVPMKFEFKSDLSQPVCPRSSYEARTMNRTVRCIAKRTCSKITSASSCSAAKGW